jgi:hypothetical protein
VPVRSVLPSEPNCLINLVAVMASHNFSGVVLI